MLQFIPVYDEDILAIRASGKLTHADYQTFLPLLEKQLATITKPSLLLELDNFTGWDLKAAKDDLDFGTDHPAAVKRIAVVGDKLWEHWMTLMTRPFLADEKIRYFDHEDLQQAWDWLREDKILAQASESPLPYQHILAAVDFSPYSKLAAKRAIDIAKRHQAQLTLLHVTQEVDPYQFYFGGPITGYEYDYDYRVVQKQNEQQLAMAHDHMKAFLAELDTDGININTEVSIGNKDSAILSYLESLNINLVVFGARKKKGLSKLLGSTAQHIHNNARCEILVVPLLDPETFERY